MTDQNDKALEELGKAATDRPITKATKFCRKCGYPLDGLEDHACPECGREFDPQHPTTYSRFPVSRGKRVFFLVAWGVVLAVVVVTIVASLLTDDPIFTLTNGLLVAGVLAFLVLVLTTAQVVVIRRGGRQIIKRGRVVRRPI